MRFWCISYIVLLFFTSISCVNTKKAVYFNNIQDTLFTATRLPDLEPVIRANDLLSISVSSLNPEASLVFNSPNVSGSTSSYSTGATNQVSGYLVNQDGYIQFPFLGNIKAAGLTKQLLKENLTNALTTNKLLVDPIVNVRYLNFRVTVLGEVGHPTVVSVPSEKISILEALGLAGDLTIYAKRDNVLLIREENGNKTVKRLNLNSSEILTSPYYYLKSNDILYAEPNKARVASTTRANTWLPVLFSGLSLAAIVIDRLTRN